MSSSTDPNPTPDWTSNRSISILKAAKAGGYGVLAQVVYDTSSALALIDAAESLKSPAMILLFPLTLRHHRGIHFLRFILDVAHAASVPIAVHLDHATTVEDINMVLDFADQGVKFDSIMIDASHAPTPEENLQLVIPHIKRATQLGIPVEVELGRLEGGEAGLRVIDEGELTDPKVAEGFMRGSGAVVLAPSIGNLHGRYLKEPAFRLDILRELNEITTKNGHLLCLHGTDQLSDQLFRSCIEAGTVKINVNSWSREPYLQRFAQGVERDEPMPEIMQSAMAAFAESCERLMRVFGSEGKA